MLNCGWARIAIQGESLMSTDIPDWVVYPKEQWQTATPEEAGLDVGRWADFLESCDVRGDARAAGVVERQEWGAALTRGGYRVHTWGDPEFRGQTASVGKALTWAAFGLAVEDGLVEPDDLVRNTWTGEGELSHPHKYLDQGFHRELTWRHLLGDKEVYGHLGGFPVTNGYHWRNATPVEQQNAASVALYGPSQAPEWATWTGDPFHDNYAHTKPGSARIYSSGGVWRLSQALTHLLGEDLKAMVDRRLFGPMGIPVDGWEWTPGRTLFETKDWYPDAPGYGDFVDPPYEIAGHVVRGGPGWVVISALDLARFGHLVATGGVWDGQRLMAPEWLRGHHGGDSNQVGGESTHITAMARVSTLGIEHPLPDELFAGPVRMRT